MLSSSNTKSPKVSVEISGGFGNQLFQLAAAQYLRAHGVDSVLDFRINQRNRVRANLIESLAGELSFTVEKLKKWQKIFSKIPVLRRTVLLPRNIRVVREETEFLAPPLIHDNRKLVYRGYWQNVEVASFIKEYVSNYFQISKSNKIARIALHVRRGDYLQGGNPNFHGVLAGEYYVTAVETIRKELGDLPILVFTDSLEIVSKELWVKNLTNLSFAKNADDLEDFTEIAKSQAIVCSNSTFSWWAAYVSDASNIILPSKWQRKLNTPHGLLQANAKIVTALFVGQD
jgi:hypothetical protein